MYAFTVVDEDGSEGVIGLLGPDGTWMPMVGADTARVEQLRPHAERMAASLGKDVTVLRFTVREQIDVIRGGAA